MHFYEMDVMDVLLKNKQNGQIFLFLVDQAVVAVFKDIIFP